MTVYTTVMQDDSNLQVQLTEADDLVTLSLTSVSLDALVTSVNGQSGIVVLDTDDIDEGVNNLYYTDGRVDTYLQSGGVTSINFGNNTSLSWNDDDGTLEFPVNGEVTLQVGQENLIHVKNLSGAGLVNGEAVYVTGASGSKLTVDVADSGQEFTSATTIALMTQDLNNNAVGYATTQGLVRGLNTSAYAEGAAIYLNSNGGWSTTKPATPDHLVPLGWIVRSHATEGSVFVHINNGQELEELHDVLITNVANNDLIAWDSANSYWKNIANNYATTDQLPVNVSELNNDSGYITASSTDTLTNKSGLISQWTNDAGYLTSETDSQTLSFSSPDLTISNGNTVDISALLTGYATEAYADQAEADAITSANSYTDTTIPNSTIDGGTF